MEDDYDHKQLPPFNHMKVLIGLVEIYEFNDLKETIDFNVKIGFSWIGNGITWIENNSTEINDLFDLKKKDLIWTPTFTVAKTIDFSIVEHFESTSYMFLRRLDENLTRFYYSFNAKIKMACALIFVDFPFDTQTCKFKLTSWDMYEPRLVFLPRYHRYMKKNWNGAEGDWNLQTFEVSTSNFTEGERKVPGVDTKFVPRNYSSTGFNIILKRYSQSYIWKYYLPCSATVIASWVSFVIPPEVIPGRAGILMTLFLVSMTIFQSILESTPTSGELTGLSYFAMVSNFFIGGAILEYACLLFIKRNISFGKKKNSIEIGKSSIGNSNKARKKSLFKDVDQLCLRTDRFFLGLFFLAYSIFIIYTILKNGSL